MAQLVPNVFLTQSATLQTTLYRSYAYRHPRTNHWKVVVHGRRAYDIPTHLNLTKQLMLRGLLKRLELGHEVLTNPNFQSRVSGFLVCAESGEKIRAQVGQHAFALRRKTRKSGLFSGRTTVPEDFFRGHKSFGLEISSGSDAQLHISAHDHPVNNHLLLAERSGLSIVSDIDDTIKQTDVTNRRQMLERTFIDPFQPIHGMADLYQQWSSTLPAMFHYVSSSPSQLYNHLEDFLDDFGFPVGSIHLRWFTLREEFLKKWRLSRGRKKQGFIQTLFKRMPHRKFLLIGDSSESDPEIYADLAAKYPKIVIGVLIRELHSNPISTKRQKSLQASLNGIPMKVFYEPSDLVDIMKDWKIEDKLRESV